MMFEWFLLILAFVLWAVVHSVLAALGVKARARQKLGPAADRWYRLGYNLFALASFAPVLAVAALSPGRVLYSVVEPWRWLLRAGQVASIALFLVALWQTDLQEFAGLRQLRADRPASAATLRTDGLQAWVRHPLYAFSLPVLWLQPDMTTIWLLACVLTSLYLYIGSIFEERRLRAEFGDAYADYQRRTPRLLPRPPRMGFHTKTQRGN